MPRENSSNSSGFTTAAIVTVAGLGLGALAGYLLAEHATKPNTEYQQRPRVGLQLRELPAPRWSDDDDDSEDERKNRKTKKPEECVLCLTDINRYSERTMMCGHRIHVRCWKRMEDCRMTCPTCSDSVFSA